MIEEPVVPGIGTTGADERSVTIGTYGWLLREVAHIARAFTLPSHFLPENGDL